MVVYNTPTHLAGCGFCGADEAPASQSDVAPIFPRDEDEYAIAPNPATQTVAPKTTFDTAVEKALKPVPSWTIGLGIGVVALGVIGAVYAVSKRL